MQRKKNKQKSRGKKQKRRATISDIEKQIYDDTFYGFSISFREKFYIPSISIPQGVRYMRVSALQDCHELTSLTLPDTLVTIGPDAFSECSGLTSLALPEGLTRIGDNAFKFCTGLVSITLPNTLTHIGAKARD